jgi:DNA ligase-1
LDVVEGIGNRVGTAGNLVCRDTETEKEFHSNIKGTFEYLTEILENKDDYIGKLVTVKYFQLTPDGVPRFPFAIGFRDYE